MIVLRTPSGPLNLISRAVNSDAERRSGLKICSLVRSSVNMGFFVLDESAVNASSKEATMAAGG
jgi:hypothetical protein